MIKPVLIGAYASRLVSSLSVELGSPIATIRHHANAQACRQEAEWTALLANGTRIELFATISTPGSEDEMLGALSQQDLEQLRELGISLEGTESG
jgi:hypothetical protein